MSNAQALGTHPAVHAPEQPGTLRARLEQLRAQGTVLNVKQAVGIVVPLCVEIADQHRTGSQLFVHPSCLVEDDYGFYHVSSELSAGPPTLTRDKACLAPEQRGGQPGGPRATVYAAGAILYELLTGASVGPGMRRPSELVSGVPQNLEAVLSKALVADVSHRPDDLNALAQALYNVAPSGSIRPPPADPGHMDHVGDLEVDVSMSMLPPPSMQLEGSSPYHLAVQQVPVAKPTVDDTTSELSALKDRLESDPRPRYVAIKDGMDHGPFNAVELLQQIANHTFEETDYIRDSFTQQERMIKEWDEFAPFGTQARLHRHIKAEKHALERTVVQEARSTRGKAFIGIVVVGFLLAGAAYWFLVAKGRKSDELAVHGETMSSVETDGGLTSSKKGGPGGVGRSAGGFPILGGGMSCEQAQSRYVEEMSIGGPRGQADITAGQYGAILNRGGYFSHCGVPNSTQVYICAAVQNGRAVGVTVTTNPRNPQAQACIAGSVRRLSFPVHPKLDVTRTSFQ
jgi:hypothetical protein